MLIQRLRAVAAGSPAKAAIVQLLGLRFLRATRHVDQQAKLVASTLLASRQRRVYRLRGDTRVWLCADDLETLDEIFERDVYGLGASESPQRVLDLGGNVGLYSAFVADQFPEVEIVTVEPDPTNAGIVRRLINANGLANRWTLVEAAATTKPGRVRFRPGGAGGAVDELGPILTPAIDALPLLASCDLAKVDIEGSEWAILLDPRFADCAPPTLLLEYHRYLCPERDPDFLKPDPNPKRLAIETLTAAGYEVTTVADSYWGHGILRASRRNREHVGSGGNGLIRE